MALAAAGSVAVAQMLSSSGLRPQPLSLGQQQQQLLFSPQIATSTSFSASPSGSRVVAVRAKAGFGTQFFKKRAEEEEEEEEANDGTQVFKNFFSPRVVQEDDEDEDASPQQTRKFAVPEEIPAAPQGIFGLVKLPFAALMRGRPADRKTVFVAGATGLTGARVVVELLAAGLSVRAGVEDLSDAQQLAELAAKYKVITGEEAKRLNFVEYSASDSEFTAKSIANAGTVVVTLGAGENGPSGSLEVEEALSLARAAILANAPSFVLVSDFAAAPAGVAVKGKKAGGGGGGGGLIATILAFFRSLAGRKGESASYSAVLSELVEAESLEYTVLRVGSFEADSSAYRTNVVVGEEGSISVGSVSRVQVAQVIAAIAANPGLAANKVVDLVASAGAEAADVAELLAEIPEDPRRAVKKEAAERAQAEEQQKQLRLMAAAEAEAAVEEARRAAENAAALEAQAKALAAEEARAAAAAAKAAARAEAASTTVAGIETNLKQAGASIPPPSSKPAPAAAAAAAIPTPSIPSFADFTKKIPTPDIAAAASSFASAASAAASKATSGGTEKAVAAAADAPKQRRPLRQRQSKAPAAAAPAAPAAPKQQAEKRKVLGGFLVQETVYADEGAGDF
ncbi:hypothetical protein CLOM_g15005 [Closterium sp. NIES-68]|nr:hypothetical protein CLOM_g15005 [Closterium sp. NIES-68]GJP66241.1 hypothetical protein CLOP_g23138 [Closterium sp. NIES-67]